MRILLLPLLTLFCCLNAQPINYYISPSGDDSNDGLSAVDARATLNNLPPINKGDTIFVAAGEYLFDDGVSLYGNGYVIQGRGMDSTIFKNNGGANNGDANDDCDPDSGEASDVDWTSDSSTDYDDDGCQDSTTEDGDDDNDGIADGDDDCATGDLGWTSDSNTDYDQDGCQDDSNEDLDDDNDGSLDDADSDDNNIFECSDTDNDGCEDCISGQYDTSNDGADADGDGQCDLGDVDIALHADANLISFYALPEDGDYGVDNIFGALGSNAQKIFGEGEIAYNLDGSSWVGSLSDVSETSGYWLIVEDATSMQVQGLPTGSVEYSTHTGNNLLSYSYSDDQSLEDALSGTDANSLTSAIYGEGIMAANIDGMWAGSMTGFEAGSGYWFVANSPYQFEYNAPASGALFRLAQLPKPPKVLEFTQSMNQYFYLITEAEIDGIELATGDWLVAKCNDVVVGSRHYTAGSMIDIPIMGYVNDPNMPGIQDRTSGYCEIGDEPQIEVHRSNGEIEEMYFTVDQDSPGGKGFQPFGHALGRLNNKMEKPVSVRLHEAYPNPFNPSTTIKYDLNANVNVELAIYDVRGRLVDTLVDEYQTANSDYKVMWNADMHSSGVYFVRLTAGDEVKTNKIMLVK